jgi:hypothetical protein
MHYQGLHISTATPGLIPQGLYCGTLDHSICDVGLTAQQGRATFFGTDKKVDAAHVACGEPAGEHLRAGCQQQNA